MAEGQRQHQKKQGKRTEWEGAKRVREGEGRVKGARETAARLTGVKWRMQSWGQGGECEWRPSSRPWTPGLAKCPYILGEAFLSLP